MVKNNMDWYCDILNGFRMPKSDMASIMKSTKSNDILKPERVIYNDPATIIIWNDKTKTVVKAHDGDQYDPVVGFLLCVMKKFYGNKSKFNEILHEFDVFGQRKVEVMKKFYGNEPKVEVMKKFYGNEPKVEGQSVKFIEVDPIKVSSDRLNPLNDIPEPEPKKVYHRTKRAIEAESRNKPSNIPALMKFLDDNEFSYLEFDTLAGFTPGTTHRLLFIAGEGTIRKSTIDKILDVTGLEYEELYEMEVK